jgi:uncharacterized OsmC-like protein
MMGTLATVMAKKKIRTFQDRYKAFVTGDIEDVNGLLKITRIHVRYDLRVPPHQEADARWALETYITLCPAAQSVVDSIDLTHELAIELEAE